MQDDERQPLVANEERAQMDDAQTPLLEANVSETAPSEPQQECLRNENPSENVPSTSTTIAIEASNASSPAPPPAFLDNYPETTDLPPEYDSAYNRDWAKNCPEVPDPQSNFIPQLGHYPNDPSHSYVPRIPSYDEAERQKDNNVQPCRRRRSNEEPSDEEIGSGFAFMGSMFVSFIFSWIGFIICYCASSTIAGRYGAFAGFGLSLIKWALILQHVNFDGNVATGDHWLWWIVVAFGWFIFMRAVVVYCRFKNMARNRHLSIP